MTLKKELLLYSAAVLDYFYDVNKAVFNSDSDYYAYFSDKNHGSIKRGLEDLLKIGNIEKVVEDGVVKYRITSSGKVKLISEISLLKFKKEPWDGIWRMIIFDVPETERKLRDALRFKLKELGFGKWQESVYISPFKISEQIADFIKSHALDNYAVVLETKKILIGEEKELARTVWNLDDLNNQYLDFLAFSGSLMSELAKKVPDKKKIKDLWRKTREAYHQLLFDDPGLPKELLPKDWAGEEAQNLFKKTAKIISQKAF